MVVKCAVVQLCLDDIRPLHATEGEADLQSQLIRASPHNQADFNKLSERKCKICSSMTVFFYIEKQPPQWRFGQS